MLGVFEAEKLIAAYPVTVGSAHTTSPIGEWKVRGIAKLPRFRYDKEMLEHGERSGNFYMLPPGPRNPVGVMWIALNKKGIGIHGTNDPGSIGRAVSHGCIRLANWDVVRLATKIKRAITSQFTELKMSETLAARASSYLARLGAIRKPAETLLCSR